ncbi:hypothetical protein [Lacrimispora sp.]|uniref:hypothetical protein n=1 Tax=Lacrimispora sp. TaxID=2719234 RepID=UPI003460370A
MENNVYDQEIDLKDLIFAVFRKWRPIILAAIALAILLGGVKCAKEIMKRGDEDYVLELEEKYNSDLGEYEQAKSGYEWSIERLTASIDYQEKYRESSVLMKVDPYNEATAVADIFIQVPDPFQEKGLMVTTMDTADGIVKAYASGIMRGEALKSVSRQMGIGVTYLKELVNITTDYDSNMLNVSVTYTDENGAQKILDSLLDNIETLCFEIQTDLEQHTISIMNQNVSTVVDQSLADVQDKKLKDLTITKKSLEETKKALEELKEPDQPTALSKRSVLKECVKYGIIGGVFGAFMVAFGVCIVFVMNGKLNADSDLKGRFRLKFLGGFTDKTEKRAFSGIDDWIDRLEGKKDISDETMYDMLAINIRNLTDEETSVLFTGTVGDEALTNLAMKLQERLPNFQLKVAADMIRNTSTLQSVSEFDDIILVEMRKESRLRDIEKEVEIVSNMKKEFLGYIVLASGNKGK